MADYRCVDHGTDADGRHWEIGTRGADVLVYIPDATRLRLGGGTREQFTRAWMEAERRAEETGIPVVVREEARHA